MDAFELPIRRVPSNCSPHARTFIEQFIDIEIEEISQRLQEVWFQNAGGSVRQFANYVLSFTPAALIVEDTKVSIQLGSITSGGFEGFIVPVSVPHDSLDNIFDQYKFCRRTHEILKAFLERFSGLRETLPPLSGYFAEFPWTSLPEFVSFDDLEYGVWRNALPFFHTLAGDMLLVNSDGQTAWWLCEEQRIALFLEDIEAVLDVYTKFKQSRREFWLFDPYEVYEFLGIRLF